MPSTSAVLRSLYAACILCSCLAAAAGAAGPCIETNPGASYVTTPKFLTFEAPPHSPTYHLQLSDGRYTGDYPDCLSFNGTRVKELGAVGEVNLDSAKGDGKIRVEFNGTIMPEAGRGPLSGHFVIESNGEWLHTVPFMRNGISTNFIQHGCTGQGEPGFPQLKAYFSTWGNCDVKLDGQLLYKGVWMHTMFTNRMRETGSNAIWADATHTRAYDPKKCWEGDVRDDELEMTVVVARNCKSPDPHQVHASTDVNIALSFTGIRDISPQRFNLV